MERDAQLRPLQFLRNLGLWFARFPVYDWSLLSDRHFSRNPFSPSLDRIDRRGFHTDDNTRITSTLANTAMSEWGVEYLEETAFHILCMRVPSHLRDALMAWRNYQTTFGVSGVESTAANGLLGDVRQRVTK